jgi:hypothetical protein
VLACRVFRSKTTTIFKDFFVKTGYTVNYKENRKDKEHLTAWLLFLQNPEAKYMEALMKENPIIEKAHSKLKELSIEESLHLIAEARLKEQLDHNSDMDTH